MAISWKMLIANVMSKLVMLMAIASENKTKSCLTLGSGKHFLFSDKVKLL